MRSYSVSVVCPWAQFPPPSSGEDGVWLEGPIHLGLPNGEEGRSWRGCGAPWWLQGTGSPECRCKGVRRGWEVEEACRGRAEHPGSEVRVSVSQQGLQGGRKEEKRGPPLAVPFPCANTVWPPCRASWPQ